MRRRPSPVAEVPRSRWPQGVSWVIGSLHTYEDSDAARWADALERGDVSILDEETPDIFGPSVANWISLARAHRKRGLLDG